MKHSRLESLHGADVCVGSKFPCVSSSTATAPVGQHRVTSPELVAFYLLFFFFSVRAGINCTRDVVLCSDSDVY